MRIEGVIFGYSSLPVFRDFSWHAEKPIAILEGPSGCGKTTLLRILAGHLKLTSYSFWGVPQDSRLILQDDGLFPWLTADGNLALAPEWRGFRALSSDLDCLAELVKPYTNRIVGTLSFGQRRILELLRVFGCPPPLVLLDEPVNFLDASRRKAVIDTIGKLASHGHRFVISSHYETDFGRLECQRFRFAGDMPYHSLEPVDAS